MTVEKQYESETTFSTISLAFKVKLMHNEYSFESFRV